MDGNTQIPHKCNSQPISVMSAAAPKEKKNRKRRATLPRQGNPLCIIFQFAKDIKLLLLIHPDYHSPSPVNGSVLWSAVNKTTKGDPLVTFWPQNEREKVREKAMRHVTQMWPLSVQVWHKSKELFISGISSQVFSAIWIISSISYKVFSAIPVY